MADLFVAASIAVTRGARRTAVLRTARGRRATLLEAGHNCTDQFVDRLLHRYKSPAIHSKSSLGPLFLFLLRRPPQDRIAGTKPNIIIFNNRQWFQRTGGAIRRMVRFPCSEPACRLATVRGTSASSVSILMPGRPSTSAGTRFYFAVSSLLTGSFKVLTRYPQGMDLHFTKSQYIVVPLHGFSARRTKKGIR